MTRKLFLLVLLLSIFKISYSQTNHYGLSIGTSASFMERGERERYNTISSPKGPGFLISAFYNYKLNNYFGVVSNVSFNSRNVLEAPFTNIEGDEDFVKFNYLSITPLLKFDTNGNYNKGFYLKTGLSYEVLLNSKIKKENIDLSSAFKNSIAANFGYGVDFKKHIGIEMLFSYTLNNTLKYNDEISSNLLGIYLIMNVNINDFLN